MQGGCTPVGCVLIQILKLWNASVTTTCHKRAMPVATALGAEDIVSLPDLASSNDSSLSLDDRVTLNNVIVKELELKGAPFDAIITTRECNLSSNELQSLLGRRGTFVSTVPTELLTDLTGFPINSLLSVYIHMRYYLMVCL